PRGPQGEDPTPPGPARSGGCGGARWGPVGAGERPRRGGDAAHGRTVGFPGGAGGTKRADHVRSGRARSVSSIYICHLVCKTYENIHARFDRGTSGGGRAVTGATAHGYGPVDVRGPRRARPAGGRNGLVPVQSRRKNWSWSATCSYSSSRPCDRSGSASVIAWSSAAHITPGAA